VATPYPDPSYSDSPRRFYIGYNHYGPYVVGATGYFNWMPLWQTIYPDVYYGLIATVETSDPANAYIEFTIHPWESQLPDWRIGDTIFNDDPFNRWATIVPWVPEERALYLYPASPSVDDKIYYANTQRNFPPFLPDELDIADVLNLDYDGTGLVIITELGSDESGSWFKCRAATEVSGSATLIQWTAGNIGNTTTGINRYFDVMPFPTPLSVLQPSAFGNIVW